MKAAIRTTKRHLSPGLALGVIAVLVALGGTSIAGGGAAPNSVGAKALKGAVLRTAGGTVDPGELGDFTANCKATQQLISGGVDVDSDTTAVQFLRSHPNGNGWQGVVYSTSATPHEVTVQALCLRR